jgi:hypothetical protein
MTIWADQNNPKSEVNPHSCYRGTVAMMREFEATPNHQEAYSPVE